MDEGQQVIVEKEQAAPVRSILRLIVSIIIIVLIAALCFGVWLLIKYAWEEGLLF